MRCRSAAIRLAVVSLMAVLSVGPWAGFAGSAAAETFISPISLSANVPGLTISPKLIEQLIVRTGLSRSELELLRLQPRKLDEEDVQRLLESEREFTLSRFVRFFDIRFRGSSEQEKSSVWRSVGRVKGFISDAISLGGLDQERKDILRDSLKKAAKKGDDQEQIEARVTAHQLLREARDVAVRRARGYRQLIDALGLKLGRRDLEQNIGMILEVRTSAQRPTISPLSRVTIECAKWSDTGMIPKLVFRERRRECGDFGVCRVESIATLGDGPGFIALFKALKDNGRRLLDGCSITTEMLIDGEEVEKTLPGRFTSHIAPQSR